jgi:protein-S-isoprenylcysteine O-methyltransferase Ste14
MKLQDAYFAARGWILLIPFAIVLAARSLSDAPLRPEWLIYIVAAAALRLWAGAHLGEHGNAAQPEAAHLIRTGPYRSSRNPLYVANIFTAAGLIFFANALPLTIELMLVAFVIVHHLLLVRHEEAFLRARHGIVYTEYMEATPRWWGLARPKSLTKTNTEDDSDRVSLPTALRRQARNLFYALISVGLIWIAARWF